LDAVAREINRAAGDFIFRGRRLTALAGVVQRPMLTQPMPAASATLYARLRDRWIAGIRCSSDVAFAIGVSLLWLLLYNDRFWQLTMNAMWHPSVGSVVFLASLFALTLSLQAILLLLWPTRVLMRIAASALFVIAALGSYFCSEYGAIMNKEMMRNVMQTDTAEVGALLNPELWLHVVLLGLLPAYLVWRVRLPELSFKRQLTQRALGILGALAISTVCLFASSANYATFFREHKPVRFTLSPAAEVVSMAGLLASGEGQTHASLSDPAGQVERTAAPAPKPLVLFLVIGETARAANFQLGGYDRETNPELSRLAGVTYFRQTTACGTSTAVSVPCLFSHLPRSEFKVDAAGRYTNLLDSLVKAGFDVEWRDNNSGCKGVCARVASIDYSQDPQYCTDSNCFDEVMLSDLPARLEKMTRDTVIVFHQKGSHGPAYAERYPATFEKFQPACRSNQLQRCSPQEIANAYDNSIVYTDHVLARQIAILEGAASRLDGLLIYVSDHGESLGENGIYLHGMPYAFAPAVQKEVPMLVWTSSGYARRTQLKTDCLQATATVPVSHDFFYHTVLAAAEVRNQVYDRRLDLISGCRRGAGGE
jgi:lipid A ethanolaminephosphotransferase